MMNKTKLYFTGVGARVTPQHILEEMTEISRVLSAKGVYLRSGGQPKGADGAFERGGCLNKQIFKPRDWQRHGDLLTLPLAYDIAAKHHPYWENLQEHTKDLMARNVHAVLGPNLDDPSEFLICWTKDGIFKAKDRSRDSGGTGHTISVADEAGVPIFNLKNKEHHEYVMHHLIRSTKETHDF